MCCHVSSFNETFTPVYWTHCCHHHCSHLDIIHRDCTCLGIAQLVAVGHWISTHLGCQHRVAALGLVADARASTNRYGHLFVSRSIAVAMAHHGCHGLVWRTALRGVGVLRVFLCARFACVCLVARQFAFVDIVAGHGDFERPNFKESCHWFGLHRGGRCIGRRCQFAQSV